MANLAATDEFHEAIKEIQLLINYSKRNQRDALKYKAFNKAATVLLCAKFESFIENFLEEYAYELICNSTNKTLCKELFEYIIDDIIKYLEDTKNNKEKRKQHINKLVDLCSSNEIENLDFYRQHINSKLKMGKHGQKEIERLLTNFGFGEIIGTPTIVDFFRQFNSLNSIRNNIIHEDATPSLTHTDVQNYLYIVNSFVRQIQSKADELLTTPRAIR